MERKLILAGLGGQGVVFLTRLISQAAIYMGHQVMVSETHGMSQRGGSVISHLKIGGDQAPLIRRGTAHALLALEADEAVRNLSFVRPGGLVVVNAEDGLRPEVAGSLEELAIQVHALPASRMAQELGAVAVTNVILAGYAANHPALSLPMEALAESVKRVASKGQELNQKALEVGYKAGQHMTSDKRRVPGP
jgi:indolepyruvate ferredoxin oxidoreductase beta subunit